MRVDVSKLLAGYVPTIFGKILPALGRDYSAGSLGVIGVSLVCSAQEFDRAADVLSIANTEIRGVFAHALGWLAEGPLSGRLREAAAGTEGSLRISVLGPANDKLNALLVELHAHVEVAAAPEAKETERRILEHLHAHARRELVELPPM